MAAGDTALHFVAKCFEKAAPKLVELLLDHGALLGIKNSAGETPLLLAVERMNDELVEYLICRPECTVAERVDALLLLGTRHSEEYQVCIPTIL